MSNKMVWTAFKDATRRTVVKIRDLEEGRPIREKWNIVFVISCLLAVLTDPFFLYVPIINQDAKCVRLDNNLKIAAVIFRSITGLVYFVNIILQIFGPPEDRRWSYILLDIASILPIPEVTIIVYFTKMRGWKSLNIRKVLNFLVMVQYVPRVYRILFAEIKDPASRMLGLWIRGVLNFLLYIFACHIMGGFWYFFSIQRMVACWQYACRDDAGCKPSTFECHDQHTNSNDIIKLLKVSCPTNPSEETIFNFGIFLDALHSGLVESTDFSKKLSSCFWWGLRNLSSFGSNLQPSINTWETLFAALTSVTGLLLVLSLIGKVQMYMQLESGNREQQRYQTERELTATERKEAIERRMFPKIEKWLEDRYLPARLLMTEIMEKVVEAELKDKQEVDIENIVSIFPNDLKNFIGYYEIAMEKLDGWILMSCIPTSFKWDIVREFQGGLLRNEDCIHHLHTFIETSGYPEKEEIQQYLPYNRLKKLKVLENLDEIVLKAICGRLRPKMYEANSIIIKEGEPLEFILFMEGTVSFFKTQNGSKQDAPLMWGQELLLWPSSDSFPAEELISSDNLYSHCTTTALVLTAADLVDMVVPSFKLKFESLTSDWLTRLKEVPAFECLNDQILKAIFMHLKQYPASIYPYVRNKPVASMNIIIKGSVKLTIEDGGDIYGDSEELVLREGQVYGEELLDWVLDTSFPTLTPFATRTAVYDNDNEVVELRITAEELKSVATEFSSHFAALPKKSQKDDLKTLVGMTLLKRVSIFENQTDNILKAICEKLQLQSINGYEKIITCGQPIDRMLIAVRGTICISKAGHEVEETLFGEEIIDCLSSDDFTASTTSVAISYSMQTHLFVLMADDLKAAVSGSKFKFPFWRFDRQY